MCVTTLAALLGLAVGCPSGAPSDLLAPLDPRAETRWHAPPSATAGLTRYAPVDARADWGDATPQSTDQKMSGMKDMPGMQGMPGMRSMPEMKAMPGMGAPR